MKQITSLSNPLITLTTSLHHGKYRTKHKLFIAQGLRTCTTLLNIPAYHNPHAVFVTEQYAAWAHTHNIDAHTYLVSDAIMKKISTTTTPSGIVCVFHLISPEIPAVMAPALALVNSTDPGNMGTLIRTAAALKAAAVFVIGGTDPWSPKVVQASAGTGGLIPIIQIEWNLFHAQAKKHNAHIYALTVSGGKNPRTLSFNNSVLVVGNEAHGLSDTILKNCDELITLSMPGGTESLNAAVAGAIALYVAMEHI